MTLNEKSSFQLQSESYIMIQFRLKNIEMQTKIGFRLFLGLEMNVNVDA
jgi:hypothetical protein